MTTNWCAKPIKVKKSTEIFHGMVESTLSLVKDKKQLSPPVIPQLPKNIAPFPKPLKEEVIARQKSRFSVG